MIAKVIFLRIVPALLLSIQVLVSFGQTKVQIYNPILKGYFADPALLQYENKFYIYATIDPWGQKELAVFETTDFQTFEQKHLSWPTKEQCTSSTSSGSMVWAPSVVKAPNGKFYMYVSVGSEIWAGVSDHPLGPWQNAKADQTPLIRSQETQGIHTIDSDCFIDDDGQAYLYWGSGLNWVNGHCLAVKLNKDMVSFDSEPLEITPPHYFEAPHMIKRNGRYYLMYSDGKAIDHTYKIRYSTSLSPLGPWMEGETSPILQTSADSTTYGPGHHCVFTQGGQDYILYHRIYPQKEAYVLRQLCLDRLVFDKQKNIQKIHPGTKPIPIRIR